MAAMGLPAGVGESCRGLRRVARTPRLFPSAAGSLSEKTPNGATKKRRVHGAGVGAGELEITQVGGSLVGVEAGQRCAGIIVEHSGNRSVLRVWVGVGDHMQQR